MFIDIDYNKRLKGAKLHLAKPNKQIISHISEKFKDDLLLRLGNINELNFSIPHSILNEDTNELIFNPHIDSIKEKMLIRVTMDGYIEWYVVDSIEEDGNDSDTFNVKCLSLGQELAGKRIVDLKEDGINATNLLKKLLLKTVWKIGEVDPLFDVMFRSFESGENSNVLDCILNAGETYGALIVWDTENRKVSFKNMKENGSFRGMSANYGKFLNSIKRTRTTDELVTRFYIYGFEGLQIHSMNPTGMPYIEDFSYFMYPFERDENRLVLNSSHFMSDNLCHAILDHKNLMVQNAPLIKALTDDLKVKQTSLVTEQSKLDGLRLDLDTILNLLDTAKATENSALIAQRQSEYNAKQAEINTQTTIVNEIESDIDIIEAQISAKQSEISTQANFTTELLEELNLYIHEREWRDDRYIDVKELYEDGIKKFEEIRQPKVIIEANIENLLNIIEEQYYWDKLVLGDLIKIKYPQMKLEYMAKIIEMKFDLENGEINLTIANTIDLLNNTDKLVQLLYQNSNASTLIQNNKYKWNKVSTIETEVSRLLNSEWDATKNKIIAGVNNSVEVGNRGIIIKNPDFPNEVVILQSGVIALSKDGGITWKTAIKPDGIVAERLIGKIIASQELLITNNSGSFIINNDGVEIDATSFVIRSGANNLVNEWNNSKNFVDAFKDDSQITAYEKKMLKTVQWDKIESKHIANTVNIEDYYGSEDITPTFVTDYNTKYNELYNYLFIELHDGAPMLDPANMSNTTNINRVIFDSRFKNYDLAQVELDKQLLIKAKSLSDKAIQDAKNAQDNVNEVMDDVVYKIELHSSMGWVFKNGQINTVITAKVYRGKDDITDTIPASGFVWRKYDKNGTLDTNWNSLHVNVGKQITITREEVYQKAIFQCDIDVV